MEFFFFCDERVCICNNVEQSRVDCTYVEGYEKDIDIMGIIYEVKCRR